MMNDNLTEDTKAIILLCGVFGEDRSQKPLSSEEYSSLVLWLMEEKMRPVTCSIKIIFRKHPSAQESMNSAWNHCLVVVYILASL